MFAFINPERGFLRQNNLHYVMKRIIERKDLMSKMDYSRKYGVNRVAIDKMIEDGKLVVERISGVDYIRLSQEEAKVG